MEKTIHQGRNIKRFREMMGLKQEALAYELGDDWTQKKVSLLEAKEEVDNDLLEQVAKVLKVPGDAIRNFDEEKAVNIISNTASFDNCQQPSFFNHYPTFNPIDKMIELYESKIQLYERMLKDKEEMIEELRKLVIKN
jgi:transcriptional regulator with XRE-family HTH domain